MFSTRLLSISLSVDPFFLLILTYLPLVSAQEGGEGRGADPLMFLPPKGCQKFAEVSLCNSGHCVDINNVSQPGIPNSPSSMCLCDPGWTGASDYIDMTGHDCSTNKLYVKTFWSINTGFSFMLLLFIVLKLIKSFIRLCDLVESNSKKKSPSDPHHRTPEHSRTQSSTMTTSIEFPPSPQLKRQQSSELHLQIQQSQPGTPDHHSQNRPGTPNQQPPGTPDHQVQVRSGTPDLTRPGTPQPPPLTSSVRTQTNYQTLISEFLSWEVVKISLISLPVPIALAIVGLGRASGSGEENLIGKCWWTTLFHAVSLATSSITQKRTTLQWMSVRNKVVRFTEQNAERAQQMIQRTRRCLKCLYGVDVIIFVIYNLMPTFSDRANIVVVLFLVSLAVSTWIQAFAITRAATELEKILLDGLDRLRGSSKNEREKTLKNIVRLKQAYRRSLFTPFLMISTTLWPFMRTKASYFLPISAPFQTLAHFLSIYNCAYPTAFQNKALGTESHSKDKSEVNVKSNTLIVNRKPSSAPEGVELKQLGSLRESDEESSRRSSPSSTPYLAPRSLDSSARVPYIGSTPSVRPLENPPSTAGSIILPSAGALRSAEMDRLELGGSRDAEGGYAPLIMDESTKEIHLMSGSRPESRSSPSADEDLPDVEHGGDDRRQTTTKHIFNPFYKAQLGGGESRPEDTD